VAVGWVPETPWMLPACHCAGVVVGGRSICFCLLDATSGKQAPHMRHAGPATYQGARDWLAVALSFRLGAVCCYFVLTLCVQALLVPPFAKRVYWSLTCIGCLFFVMVARHGVNLLHSSLETQFEASDFDPQRLELAVPSRSPTLFNLVHNDCAAHGQCMLQTVACGIIQHDLFTTTHYKGSSSHKKLQAHRRSHTCTHLHHPSTSAAGRSEPSRNPCPSRLARSPR
jgi:hypothetical protein